MMIETDPFEPERDRWGRPLIDGVPFTRASTLAKALDDQSGLIGWKARQVAVGLARSPDLVALAATAAGDRRRLDDVVERATDRAGAGAGRDLGTAIHQATELLDRGHDTAGLPAELLRDAIAYRDALQRAGLTPAAAELFLVNRDLQAAGSADRILLDRDGRAIVGDLKTGSSEDPAYAIRYSALAWATQIATYATSVPFTAAGEQTWESLGLPTPDASIGFVFYIPRGSGTCHLIEIDLDAGLAAAQLAVEVRRFRSSRPARVFAK